jgi:hypothetical protein
VNIRAHVSIILDFAKNNFSMWSAFFNATFRKFGVVDHVNGSIDAQAMWHDNEWLQVNQGIVSWLYNSLSPVDHEDGVPPQADDRRDLDISLGSLPRQHRPAHHVCPAGVPRPVQAAHQPSSRCWSPIPKPSLVINTLHGLNSKFSQAISTITAMKSLPSFLHVCNYLLQEENR